MKYYIFPPKVFDLVIKFRYNILEIKNKQGELLNGY